MSALLLVLPEVALTAAMITVTGALALRLFGTTRPIRVWAIAWLWLIAAFLALGMIERLTVA